MKARPTKLRLIVLALVLLPPGLTTADEPFARGLPARPDFFPVAVWLQDPANAPRYRDIGINLYVGLWRGPTRDQLDKLDQAGIKLICGQNRQARDFLDRPTIVGWMHGDEPDNAQSLGPGKGYGPPILPSKIVEDYERIRQADPSRPILLNLGQGVAWDGYYGRGVRTNHPEDYREYARGSDIVSFDIYPAAHENKAVAGNLWYVPRGVERLRQWTDNRKPVWSCIETTRISNVNRKPTPQEVRTEVWMALIHGARGLVYFSHQFKPKFIEAGLLADPEMAAAVKAINQQIQSLAPVLNSPEVDREAARVKSSNPEVPVAWMMKKHAGQTYMFTVAMRDGATDAEIEIPGMPHSTTVTVLGEDRKIQVTNGKFTEHFKPYEVHLYLVGE